MPVFKRDEKLILYIHVPRTGGTWLSQQFLLNDFQAAYLDYNPESHRKQSFRRNPPQFMDAEQLSSVFNLAEFDLIVMTVRNPFDRLASEYFMRTLGRIGFEEWAMRAIREWQDNPWHLNNHIRPQWMFQVPGAIVVRQEEDLNSNILDLITDETGLDMTMHETDNSRSTRQIRAESGASTDLSPVVSDLVKKVYERDFETYEYSSDL